MRQTFIFFIIIVAATITGGMLYLFGGPTLHDASVTKSPSGTSMKVLAEGPNAAGEDQRVNYRITNPQDLIVLWAMVYGPSGMPVPYVDFTTQEVLGVFDGSHSTGGFSVHVTDVNDRGDTRVVRIERVVPGDSCPTDGTLTSPFEILSLPKSSLTLTHVDTVATTSCVQ